MLRQNPLGGACEFLRKGGGKADAKEESHGQTAKGKVFGRIVRSIFRHSWSEVVEELERVCAVDVEDGVELLGRRVSK